MAEALLTFAARELLKKVVTLLANEEFSPVCGFKDELALMHTTLVKLQAMLQAAERLTQDQGDDVKIWVKKIEEIAGDVDVLLDDFEYEVLRCKVEMQDQMKTKVLSIFEPVVFRHKMGRRIKNINESLVNLENQAAASSFQLVVAENVTCDDPEVDKQTALCYDGDENNIIGRGEVVSDIVTTLINSKSTHQENLLSVLAIVGLAGLGKTTVAKSVYDDSEVSRHFQQKIWICVSTTFEVEHILGEILGSLNAEKAEGFFWSTEKAELKGKAAILKNLQEDLEGKRFILVLDDVWNKDLQKWDDLRTCLLSIRGTEGSNIIVTTRDVKVAKIMETLPRYDLKKLSDDECWLIFKNKAVSTKSTLPEDRERTGKEIAKKCGGVPLVAKVLGSLMRSKDSKDWLGIEKSPIWDLKKQSSRIFAVLNSSFSELHPPSLKKCFAYCSTFTKDCSMEKHDLIQRWMAMGFLTENHSPNGTQEEMEDIGNAYFNTLLGKSLFQDVTKDAYGIVTHCKMHDLVHDLAEHVSESMCFTRYSNKIQHVEHTSMQQRILKGSVHKLFMNDEVINRALPSYNTLHVLKLYRADIEELPGSIGRLNHLRYLDVSRTNIRLLPKSIGKLYHLQTLRMYHLYLLEEIPNELQNLINLRHLYFDHRLQFSVGMSKLTRLRSLTHFRVGKEIGRGIEELSELSKLEGELSIYNLEHVRDGEAKKANLVERTNIHKLKFEWSQPGGYLNSTNDEDVLEGLQPHSNLEFLDIHGFKGKKFPLWMMSGLFLLNNNLKEIELANCDFCERLPTLGHLPNLTHVRISTMRSLKCVGSEFYGYEQVHQAAATSDQTKALFPALKTLHIENAGNLTEWMEAAVLPTETVVVFPCLEELTLKSCFQLRSAPTHFPSLKKLLITAMDSSMPMKSILSNKLTTLTHLELYDVRRLTCLPDGMLRNNKNLACLKIEHCSEFTCIAHDGFENCCSSLESLLIFWCSKLKYLPDGLLTPSLKKMSVLFCANLECIPDIPHGGGFTSLQILSIAHCPQLSSLPKGIEYCTSLEKLEIQSCSRLTSIPMTQGQPLLRELYIRDCPQLSSPPSGLEHCTSLQNLHVTGCPKITLISISSSHSTSLQDFSVSHLESLPSLQGFTILHQLHIRECTGPQIGPEFSASLQTLISLHELRISCCPVVETIPSLDKLTSLSLLQISYCCGLRTLPSLVSLRCLKTLEIGRFWEELESFPAFQSLPQLESLTIVGWPKLKCLPDQIQYMTSLKFLWILSFEGVVSFPDWLGNLASLEKLTIQDCNNLMYLPSVEAMQRHTKLLFLSIFGCPLLQERCTRDSGPEWPKIRLIPIVNSY